jgi:hypothetical protein
VWLRGSKFWIRFCDSTGKRCTEFLVEKDDLHYSRTCPAVKDAAAKRMEKVNRLNSTPESAQTVGGFFEVAYLTWAKANLRGSTVEVYSSIWKKNLEPELGSVRIGDYKPAKATRFLSSLAPSMTRASLSHIRALMSGIFGNGLRVGQDRQQPHPGTAKYLPGQKARQLNLVGW